MDWAFCFAFENSSIKIPNRKVSIARTATNHPKKIELLGDKHAYSIHYQNTSFCAQLGANRGDAFFKVFRFFFKNTNCSLD